MKRSLMALLAMLAASYALAQDVQYNNDRDADFTRYKTFRWETPDPF